MQTIRLATLLLSAVSALPCRAQQAQSPWQGEWGLDDISSSRLTVSACRSGTCTVHLSHGGCSTSQDTPLTLASSTEATADLPGQDVTHSCRLRLQRHPEASQPTIDVQPSGNGCDYYCISGATGFATHLIQRSHTVYAGSHSEECMKDAGPARMATCLDASLAEQEQSWESLYGDFPLTPVAQGSSVYRQATQLDAAIIAQCDTATDPAQCLRSRFTSDIALMNAKKNAFIAGYTERGDVAEAARKGASIAGRYRHTFDNGDVQGNHYRTTDKLTITQISRNSIDFDMDLNFFNGHTCSIGGGALYRKDGSFVFDDDPANTTPPDPVCHLAIIPSAKGITFKDLTGGCKMLYCGMRGGFNGEGFLFTDRLPPTAAKKTLPK